MVKYSEDDGERSSDGTRKYIPVTIFMRSHPNFSTYSFPCSSFITDVYHPIQMKSENVNESLSIVVPYCNSTARGDQNSPQQQKGSCMFSGTSPEIWIVSVDTYPLDRKGKKAVQMEAVRIVINSQMTSNFGDSAFMGVFSLFLMV